MYSNPMKQGLHELQCDNFYFKVGIEQKTMHILQLANGCYDILINYCDPFNM